MAFIKAAHIYIAYEVEPPSSPRIVTVTNGMILFPGGGGGTPLYKLYRYVLTQRVRFSSRFGLKTGIDFDHYGLKSGMVFKGTTGAYKRICLFNSK